MPLLRTFSQNTAGRDFAVGDIHGHFSALGEALRTVGFDAAHDRLFSVGDLIDRGPESARVLDWLAQPWFQAVRGNHEVLACAALAGDAEAARCHQAVGGDWLYALPPAEREQVHQALRGLPLALEVDTARGPVGLVHADLPTDDWQDLRDGRYTSHDEACCVWSGERFRRQYAAPVRHIHAVVHGHMTTRRPHVLGNVHFIDTHGGDSEHGYFTLLDLASLKAYGSPRRRRPARPAR